MTIEKGCCIALTACAALFLLSLVRLSNSLNATILQIKSDAHTEAKKLDATLTDLDRDTVIASGTLTSIEKSSRRWSTQQDQVAKNALTATNILTADLTQAGQLLSTANSSLGPLVRSWSAFGDAAGTSASEMGASFASLASQAQPILKNASEATRLASNGLSESLPDLQATVKSTAATATNVEATTKDVRDFAHRELAPVKGTFNIIKNFLLQFAAPIATVVTSAK